MDDVQHTPVEDELRHWASGSPPLGAAVELLLHAGLAEEGDPWLIYDPRSGVRGIDFDCALAHTDELTGSEQRLLRIAVSLGAGLPIDLGDVVPGLRYKDAELVMIAIAHSAGYTRFTTTTDTTTRSTFQTRPPLASWPDEPTPPDD